MNSKIFSVTQVVFIVTFVLVVCLGIYFSLNFYHSRQALHMEEKAQQARLLEEAQQEIEDLKNGIADSTVDTERAVEVMGKSEDVVSEKKLETSGTVGVAVENYLSAIQNTYIPVRTDFYRIDSCIFRATAGEFETETALEDCVRDVWFKESAKLPTLNNLFDNIQAPLPLKTYVQKEKASLYAYGLCKENQIKLFDGELSINNFNMAECSNNASAIFQEAQNEMIRVKELYGL
jgi:hypothetical protein